MGDNRTSTKPTLEISLALSGGAAKGAFHLGFIEALLENNIEIKAISGCSAGSIVGGAIACGLKPEEVLKILKSKEFKNIFKFNWFKKSVFSIDKKAKVLDKLFTLNNLEETKIPFFVCITDINTHDILYLNHGDARSLILASCALVPFFEPVYYEDQVLADGGILDLMPTTPLINYNYPILGINIMAQDIPLKHTFKTLATKVWQLLTSPRLPQNIKRCTWYIAPTELSKLKMFSFKGLQKGFDMGYKHGLLWCGENL